MLKYYLENLETSKFLTYYDRYKKHLIGRILNIYMVCTTYYILYLKYKVMN